jgi:hypothetical protein
MIFRVKTNKLHNFVIPLSLSLTSTIYIAKKSRRYWVAALRLFSDGYFSAEQISDEATDVQSS